MILIFVFYVFFVVERDPKKRRVKPLETQASILDFDLEESSDDSDFRIEDHPEGSDDSLDSNGEGKLFLPPPKITILFTLIFLLLISEHDTSDDEDDESEESDDLEDLKSLGLPNDGLSVADVISQANRQSDSLKVNTFL